MTLHETKYCPRCSRPFICKPGNITQCQCFTVQLTKKQMQLIGELYEECLCRNCLLELKEKIESFDDDVKLEYILRNIDEPKKGKN